MLNCKFEVKNFNTTHLLSLIKIQEKGINKEEFEKSIKYYSQNPELLDSILKDLRDSLEEVFIGISHDEIDEESNSNEIIKDLLKENSKFIAIDSVRPKKRLIKN